MTIPQHDEPQGRKKGTTLVALRQRRERTIALLCEHFARDHLETHELEQLIDRAHAAESLAELDELLIDLPELTTSPEEVTGQALESAPVSRADHQPVIAVIGGVERKGRWSPARQVYALAFMGGIVLDLTDANLPRGYTDVYALAWMGGIEIIVPPELQVVSDGIGIIGGFEHGGSERETLDLTEPVLRIRGAAIMGGLEIRTAAAGAGARKLGQKGRPAGPAPLPPARKSPRREERQARQQQEEDDEAWLDRES